MARTVILSKNGQTVYPATVLDAIIDPTTGSPVVFSSSSEVEYKINGNSPDATGNFVVTHEMLGAAPAIHTHQISDITELQSELNNKSNVDHTHVVVTGITANDTILAGNVKLEAVEHSNVKLYQSENTITIRVTPFVTDLSDAIKASNSNDNYKVFVGTEAEWNEFKTSILDGEKYIVFIRS